MKLQRVYVAEDLDCAPPIGPGENGGDAFAKARATRDSGHGHCWRCGRWLDPRKPVHAGHDDHDRSVYRGAECAPCNLKAAARKGNRMSNAKQSARRNGLSASVPRPESAPTPVPRW